MSPIIWTGLSLVILASTGIIACFFIEKRREQKEKRLACLQDPVVVRQIFSR